jgi:DNA-binding NtrC family response regulator
MSITSHGKEPDAVKKLLPRDSIRIMRGNFDSEQLSDVIGYLREDGHNCTVFENFDGIAAALADTQTKLLFIAVTQDHLPRLIETLRAGREAAPEIPVLVYFKQPVPELETDLLLPEICDFLIDPFNMKDMCFRINRLLQRFFERQDELQHAKSNLISHLGMQQFIGSAPAFMATMEKIPRVATCDAPVLLIGNTGTGKEMCARAIHYLSGRANKPFIPINCGSIPVELFENEMFGHEAGAFTDARQARRGLVGEAEGGTLFLDEVDTLAPSAQVKLLRFLQDKQYRPLGASSFRQADTRVIAASNQNLTTKVQEHLFREDLYYRLKVVSLCLPSLSERKEDILSLALHFLKTAGSEYKRPVERFSQDAIQKLTAYAWPGNVRELENVVRQAVVLAGGKVLRGSDVQFASEVAGAAMVPDRESFKAAKARVIEDFERTYLNEIVTVCGGNISQAARYAQKDRRTFFGLLKKYGLTSTMKLQFDGQETPEFSIL